MQKDKRGLSLSTDSAAAVAAFDATIEAFFEYRMSTMETLDEALTADPEFALARCLKAYLFLLIGTNAVLGKAQPHVQFCIDQRERLTPREQWHVDALAAWMKGDLSNACALWERILVETPLDVLALKLLHFTEFWLGRTRALRDSVTRVLPLWSEDVPGYGYVLGMHAFGLEECGDYAQAEEQGRQSVALNPDDLWAIHAVAHTLEMQGRWRDGQDWLNQTPDAWHDRNPFKGHLWWHKALFSLEADDTEAALALYDGAVKPGGQTRFYLDVQNTASLLARLELRDVDVGDRWEELADVAESQTGDHVLAFTEMHYALALSHSGRTEAFDKLIASQQAFAKEPNNDMADAMNEVGIDLCRAIGAHARGNFDDVVALITPLRHRLDRVGGSHAQRDIFFQLLLDASLRSEQLKLSRAQLAERIAQRPNSPADWRLYGETLERLGHETQADAARDRAADLLREH